MNKDGNIDHPLFREQIRIVIFLFFCLVLVFSYTIFAR